MKYRQDIDGLRALAVSIIVLFHFGLNTLAGGYVGVDVFFVISGFLITKMILEDVKRGRFSYADFYMRRLRRLGPSLLATLALTLIAGYFILSPAHFEALGLSTQATVLSISNILFWRESGYFDTDAIYKPLLHTWSLGVEEQFYFIWPMSILLLCKLSTSGRRLILLAGVSLASLLACEIMLDRDPSAAFFLPIYRVYEFALGAGLAMTGLATRRTVVANVASIAGLALIAAAAFAFTEDQRFPGVAALIPCLGAALLIFSGTHAIANRLLSLSPIRYVGRISYSLYLVHWPILVYFAYYFGSPDTLAESTLLSAAAIALGAIFYHFIETPFRRKNAFRFRVSGKALGASALATALAITLIGGKIHQNSGYSSRLSTEMQVLGDNIQEGKEARKEAIRQETCHFNGKTTLSLDERILQCLPTDLDDAIVVLGDSHAADIWVGLSNAYPDHTIVQLTGAGCDFGRVRARGNHCSGLVDFARSWLAENAGRIRAVIYSQRAAFAMRGDPERGSADLRPDADVLANLQTALEDFAELGIPIYFWGPRPEFHPELEVIANTYPTLEALKTHYHDADYSAFERLDEALAEQFSTSPVTYLSSIAPLCDPSCPILEEHDLPVIVDYAHWTPSGATLAVKRIVSGTEDLRLLLN